MARPPAVAQQMEREGRLLSAILDIPWAPVNVLHLYLKNVTHWQFRTMCARARELRQIESAHIPESEQRGPMRFGLTGRGAAALGVAYQPAVWRSLFLETRRLDPAYWLLSILAAQHKAVWAVAPFEVKAEAVRRVYDRPPKELPDTPAKKRPLFGFTAELLTCVRVADQAYVNVLVLVDPGGIRVNWFESTLRSLQAWRRRPEFQGPDCPFPVVVIVADDGPRLTALLQLWRDVRAAVWDPGPAPAVRLITELDLSVAARRRGPLDEITWTNERGQTGPFWPGIFPLPRPSVRPDSADEHWWGRPAIQDSELHRPTVVPVELRPGMRRAGVLESRRSARRSTARKKKAGETAAGPAAAPNREDGAPDKATADGTQGISSSKAAPTARRGPPQISPQEWADAIHHHQVVAPLAHRLLNLVGLYPLAAAADLALVMGRPREGVQRDIGQLAALGLVYQPENECGYGLTWPGVILLALRAGFQPVPYARLRQWTVQRPKGGRFTLSLDMWLRTRAHTDIILRFVAGLLRSGPARGARLTAWSHLPEMRPDSAEAGARLIGVPLNFAQKIQVRYVKCVHNSLYRLSLLKRRPESRFHSTVPNVNREIGLTGSAQ